MYQARILDKDRKLKAVLPGVRWHYTRRINEATNIEIYIPKETIDEHITPNHVLYGFFAPNQPFVVQGKSAGTKPNKTKYAEIASYIQIYKGDKLKVSGKINSRTLGEIVTVSAYTEEILLETNLTPAQYGKVWDGWDLADVARDLLDGWQTIRVKAQEQWQDRMVASSNVDLTTNPGHVMLAKRSNGRYYDSGYITLKFNKSEIANFKSWDRVRWSADSEGPVKTSIQISSNGTSFSAPFDGGLPEEIGYYIGGNHDQIYIRINLYTSDTESEDENGNKVGVAPTVFALEVIARTEGNLVAGNIPQVAGVTVKELSADYASVLSVLVQACEQAGWEFNVFDGQLNLAKELGVDRTSQFVLRTGTNMEIQALEDTDDELVNYLIAYGPGSGLNRLEIILKDDASIAEYGIYPLPMEFEAETLTELQQKAQEFLNENNSPKNRFEITAVFGPDQEPEYGLGDKVRVADPDTGIVTTTRIMAEAREYNENGLSVRLELGKSAVNVQKALERESKPQKGDPGQPAPRMLTRYAPTESGPWHYVFVDGDKWMQTSTDGGNLWSPPIKIVGEDGKDGEQGPPGQDGLPGPPGKDGKTLYTWIKYADSPTSGMSDFPEGKAYIGIAYNKDTPTESDNYADYSWSLIKGADGLPGPPGEDGESLYTWIRYADSPTSGMSSDPTGKKYMGIAYNKTSPNPSSNYGDYTWVYIEGPQGPQGPPGQDGEQGPKGDPGPGTPYLGEHDPTKIYYNRSNRRDVVHIVDGGQKKYYIYKGPDGVSGAWNPNDWEYYGDTLDFVATKLLLAEDASITKTLNVGQGGTSRAGVSGEGDYRFWAGDDVPSEAPFSVDEDGNATVNSMRAINKDKPGDWIEIDSGRLHIYKDGKLYQPMQRWEIGTITNGQVKTFERPFNGVPNIYLFPASILTYSSNPAHANKNQRLVCQVEDVTPTTLQARIALVVDDGYESEIDHFVNSLLASSYSNYDWQTNPDNRPGFTTPYVVPNSTITVQNAGRVNFAVSATAYIFIVEEVKGHYGDPVGTSYYNKTADYGASFDLSLQAYKNGAWQNIKTWYVSSTQISDPAQSVRCYATDNAGGADTQYRLVVDSIALPIGMRGPVSMDTTLNGWGAAFRAEYRQYYTYCDLFYGISSMEISNTSDQIIHNGTAQYFAIEQY